MIHTIGNNLNPKHCETGTFEIRNIVSKMSTKSGLVAERADTIGAASPIIPTIIR